jgi:aminomethyltransferase
VRAGKTGEYGYDLVVRRDAADDVWTSIVREGATFEAREVGADALSICRFENWFFDPAHVPEDVTPLELQLGWRLDPSRDWVGRDAVDARRAEGVKRRLTCMLAPSEVAAGDAVLLSGERIGTVTRAERSEVRDEWVVAALLDVAYAHGGIDRYRVGEAGVPVRTVAPPLIDNHSVHVDPRRHTWQTRDELELGPLARGPRAPEGA